jgi:hypothetical protein
MLFDFYPVFEMVENILDCLDLLCAEDKLTKLILYEERGVPYNDDASFDYFSSIRSLESFTFMKRVIVFYFTVLGIFCFRSFFYFNFDSFKFF